MSISKYESRVDHPASAFKLYQDAHDLYDCDAVVTGLGVFDAKGTRLHWITLNQTIFHPHGGGQLSDQGTINGKIVTYVHKDKLPGGSYDDFEILHCFPSDEGDFHPGQTVHLHVDPNNRYLNSLWHTAAHVVDYLVVKGFPQLKGDSGQCYPGNAFMKFTSADGTYPSSDLVKRTVEENFGTMRTKRMGFDRANGVRVLDIDGHKIPCGGTHVDTIEELGKLTVKNATWEKKESKLRVSYQLEGARQSPPHIVS